MKHYIFDHFSKVGVIPVLEIDSAQRAGPLAESLLAGGLPVAEVTLRTEAALGSIELIARDASEVMVRAGTEYLQMEKVHAVGSSWMAKRQTVAEGKFDEITRIAKEASDVVKQIRRG